jgi:hypothetical protein
MRDWGSVWGSSNPHYLKRWHSIARSWSWSRNRWWGGLWGQPNMTLRFTIDDESFTASHLFSTIVCRFPNVTNVKPDPAHLC